MTEYCWSLRQERSSESGAHDAPENVSPIQGAVPRTEEADVGEGTSVLESNKEQEVTDAG